MSVAQNCLLEFTRLDKWEAALIELNVCFKSQKNSSLDECSISCQMVSLYTSSFEIPTEVL